MNFQHFERVHNKIPDQKHKEENRRQNFVLFRPTSSPQKVLNFEPFVLFYQFLLHYTMKYILKLEFCAFCAKIFHCYTIVMSSNTRVTRSKGESDGLSLPARTRPRRKPTNMENDDGDTVLNTTVDAGSGQHHPQMPVHTSPLRCQSTPPQTDTVRMQETPVPAVPATSHRPMTPHIPLPRSQDSSSSLSPMSAPLFTEDRCSSTPDDDVEVCNAEVMLINRQNRPNQTFMTHSTGGRPTSTPSTMDYTTQGDPNQVTPPVYINTAQATAQNQFFHTNNFLFQTVATGAFI